jgi:serine phosphatase RsbU (regulator of sigma subunit)/pSer/pThr/pTyr-binding forkhead associated (FHA) protein
MHKTTTTGTALRSAAYLVPLSGPSIETIELKPRGEPLVMGRHEQCTILLPADADKVSRFHARLAFGDGHWTIADLNSRWGTFLNGRKLAPEESAPLSEGDLIRVVPWTFAFSHSPRRKGFQLGDDSQRMETMVRTIVPRDRPLSGNMGDDMLAVLLESAAGIHAAQSEKALADSLLDAAIRGTGLRNATLLRPVGAKGDFEIIASRLIGEGAAYSRTLLNAAATGNVAQYSSQNMDLKAPIAQSIADMQVSAAICVPLMLGDAVAAFLYLDSRGDTARVRPNASAFCVGLGRIASLALANLKRIAMERRQASVEAELSAGAEAQRWILPPRSKSFGDISYIGESRPGRYVGGDFFDVVELAPGRVAVALGDVAGKGIPASVLMTAAQGYLHSALLRFPDVGAAVTALNKFICPRCPTGKFLTLWVGVIDANQGTLEYIDAGHGYSLTDAGTGTLSKIEGDSSLPIGVDDQTVYATATRPMPPGSRLLIVSDGLVEQPAHDVEQREEFGVDRIVSSMGLGGGDPVAELFGAIITFAGTDRLADDATALFVAVG